MGEELYYQLMSAVYPVEMNAEFSQIAMATLSSMLNTRLITDVM